MQKVWLEMKGLTLLTLSEMSDPTFLTLGSVSPFTFVSPWLSEAIMYHYPQFFLENNAFKGSKMQ